MLFVLSVSRPLQWLSGLFVLVLIVAACGQAAPAEPTATPAPVAQPVSGPASTPAAPNNRASLAQRPLTVWLPASLSGLAQPGVNQVIVAATDAFAARYPNQTVEFVVKADEGQASLLNYLRNAQRVAPTILPDLLLVDAQQIWQVVELGLAQPLTLTEITEPESFYPFAWDAVRIYDRYYGIPYFAAPIHLVYNSQAVERAPVTWSEVIEAGNRFAFAGAGSGGYADEWLVQQYLSAGGEIGRGTTVDPEALALLLTTINQARTRGTIPPEVMTYSSDNAVWSALAAGSVELASVPATVYLNERRVGAQFAAARLPAIQEEVSPIVAVYAFVILAEDSERRSQALALIDYLLVPEAQGRWAQSVNWLPARPEAFQMWGPADGYTQFLQQLLAEAMALPGERSFADFSKRLQQLTNAVMSGELTVEAAVSAFE
jgi:ABC-type glycerol-3-phosphate transport system substrate-binding protein